MESMVQLKRQGFIQLECQQFREACLPHARNVVKVLFDNIPAVAARKNDNLLNVLRVSFVQILLRV